MSLQGYTHIFSLRWLTWFKIRFRPFGLLGVIPTRKSIISKKCCNLQEDMLFINNNEKSIRENRNAKFPVKRARHLSESM